MKIKSNVDIASWYFKKLEVKKYAYFPLAQYFSKAYIINAVEKKQLLEVIRSKIIFLLIINPITTSLALFGSAMFSSNTGKYLIFLICFGLIIIPLIHFRLCIKKILGSRKKIHVRGMSFLECESIMAGSFTWKHTIKIFFMSLVVTVMTGSASYYYYNKGNITFTLIFLAVFLFSGLAFSISIFFAYLKKKPISFS